MEEPSENHECPFQREEQPHSICGELASSAGDLTVAEDALRLSLHVISLAGFGNRLSWPVDKSAEEESMKLEDTTGHELSYIGALTLLLRNFLWIIIVPRSLLSKLRTINLF